MNKIFVHRLRNDENKTQFSKLKAQINSLIKQTHKRYSEKIIFTITISYHEKKLIINSIALHLENFQKPIVFNFSLAAQLNSFRFLELVFYCVFSFNSCIRFMFKIYALDLCSLCSRRAYWESCSSSFTWFLSSQSVIALALFWTFENPWSSKTQALGRYHHVLVQNSFIFIGSNFP